MKKVLITGATGFAGKYLLDYLSTLDDYSIVGTTFSTLPENTPNAKYVKLDLNVSSDVTKCIQELLPDEIYHLAALTSPAESIKNPAPTISNNITSQVNLLEAVKNSPNPRARILIISSADVYGKVAESDIPIDESTPLMPLNPYAISKISQDFLALQYFLAYEMNIIRVRPFNHIGPGQEPKFVVPAFARQIAQIEKDPSRAVIKVGNLDAKKDFSDVRDIVIGYHMLMQKGRPGEVYNMGSGRSIKIADILGKLLAMARLEIVVEKDSSLFRPLETPDFVCDSTKMLTETGWTPKISLDQSLKDTLDYWRKVL